MLPHSNDQLVQSLEPQMEAWLRRRIRDNVPYDQMVRELLTANVGNSNLGRGQQASQLDPNALAFYQANEMKPENLAAASSRLFLGIKIECAECHNHPFSTWTRDQFWQFASFYASLAPPQRRARGQPQPQTQPGQEVRELKIPNTERTVKAKFLDGKEPEWKEDSRSREVLAEWMTSPQNPFFAKAMANRLWAHFFGIGIIDPVDEFGENNPPSHPEMLDELGKAFADAKFDPKFLIKAITATRSLSDHQRSDGQEPGRSTLVRADGAERVVAGTAVRQPRTGDGLPRTGRRFQRPRRTQRFGAGEFLTKFANFSDRRTEYQTSILQALTLMNGKFVADAATVDLGNEKAFGTLTAVSEYPGMNTKDKLDSLFLSTVSRKMRSEEESHLVGYVEKGGPSGDKKRALADVFWALLNSSEFILNH